MSKKHTDKIINIAKLRYALLFAFIIFMPNSSAAQSLSDLEPFEWKNRLILITAKTACQSDIDLLEQAQTNIDDRHIIWFLFCQEQNINDSKQTELHVSSNYTNSISSAFSKTIIERYFDSKKDSVVLIGKDTGVKYRAKKLGLNAIFSRIDSMPMRQSEMKNNSR